MFKTKIRVLLQDWTEIYNYRSRIKPSTSEFIWVPTYNAYYKILNVIHSTKYNEIILIVTSITNSGLDNFNQIPNK